MQRCRRRRTFSALTAEEFEIVGRIFEDSALPVVGPLPTDRHEPGQIVGEVASVRDGGRLKPVEHLASSSCPDLRGLRISDLQELLPQFAADRPLPLAPESGARRSRVFVGTNLQQNVA